MNCHFYNKYTHTQNYNVCYALLYHIIKQEKFSYHLKECSCDYY